MLVDELVEGDDGFGFGDSGDVLEGVDEDVHEVLVVAAEEFDEEGVVAGDEVAFDDLGDVLYFLDDGFVGVGVVEYDADEGADGVAEGIGLDDEAGALDDAGVLHFFDPLVNGGAGDAAFAGNLEEGYAGVADEVGEDFAVDVVDLVFHGGYRLKLRME